MVDLIDSTKLKGHLKIFTRDQGNKNDWCLAVDKDNLIVTAGKTLVRDLLSGAEITLFLTGFAFGTGTGAPVPADTDLETPIPYSGTDVYKAFLDVTDVSETSVKFIGFFASTEPVTQPVDLTECGLFTGTGTVGGIMFSRVTFNAITKTSTLELRMEYTISV